MAFTILCFWLQVDKHVQGFCLAPVQVPWKYLQWVQYYISLQGVYIINVFFHYRQNLHFIIMSKIYHFSRKETIQIFF